MFKPTFSLVPIVVALLAMCGSLRGEAPCCQGCGCQPCTRKVCKLVCESKKVPTPVYSVECEDFCLPGPSVKCKVPCGCPDGCHSGCHKGYKVVYKPTCGKVRTRANLVVGKKEKEVPSYKCVVEEVCARCGHCAHRTTFPSATDPASARALAGDEGTSAIADPGLPASVQTVEAETRGFDDEGLAGRSLVERLFTRR